MNAALDLVTGFFRTYWRLAALGLVLLAGCPTPQPVPSQPDATDAAPAPEPDAAPWPLWPDASADAASQDDAAALDDCARAEATIVRLACKSSLGQPLWKNKHNVPFAVTCREDAAKQLDLHPACIARAATCAAVFACGL